MNDEVFNTQVHKDARNISEDPNYYGFDLQAGQSWIYPTNFALRDYQFNIIQQALYKNTLVSLPTGLGKTFIAAVVMYNFYRWYPHGKIIFMAPTRPLVKQQIEACYNIMAIPQDVTAELTGTKVQAFRADIWQSKRVFFITPHVLQNDLDNILSSFGSKIKCLVFDEAHKAKGNFAYCEVIRKLIKKHKVFRVLALSATPGSSLMDVSEVIQNLLITHLEFRTEESDDVKPYVFKRSLETVVVPLGDKLEQVKTDYLQILEKYTRTLISNKVIQGNCSNLTKGKIFLVMKDFQAKNVERTPKNIEIIRNLNICVTLYHAYEVLIRHGLRGFLNFFQEHINKPLLRGNTALIHIMEDCKDYLGPMPNLEPLPDGSFCEIPANTKYGHPKFFSLRDILIEHFTESQEDSRVMVFFEYRESVMEAYALLLQSRPTIKPRVFIGQSSGISQKVQVNVIKAFREGECNTLLSTCIGEEGLDVGEVNLIVCFDISNKSPIRMVQRMGRTGRKKEGRVVILVTEGKEQETLKDCLIYKNNLTTHVLNSPQLLQGMYQENPRMVPPEIQPKCEKLFITVRKLPLPKNSGLKEIFRNLNRESSFVDDVEIIEIEERISQRSELVCLKGSLAEVDLQSKINFETHLEKQRSFQSCSGVKPSMDSQLLVELLQFADSKRFNIPTTQNIPNQVNKNLRQGDIRTMLFKPIQSQSTSLSQELSQFPLNPEKDFSSIFPPNLFLELTTYLTIRITVEEKCKICKLFECPKLSHIRNEKANLLTNWNQPDLSILDRITAKDLNNFTNSLLPKSEELHSFEMNDDFDMMDMTEIENIIEKEEIKEKSFAFSAPKGFNSLLKSFHVSSPETPEITQTENNDKFTLPIFTNLETTQLSRNVIKNVEIAYTHSASEDTNCKTSEKNDLNTILRFFNLESLEDLFGSEFDPDCTQIYTPELKLICDKAQVSPDMFEQSPDLFSSPEKNDVDSSKSESPILCTYDRSHSLQAKRKLFEQTKNSSFKEDIPVSKPNLSNLTKFVEKKTPSPPKNPKFERTKIDLDIDSLCDLSFFGLDKQTTDRRKEEKVVENKRNDLEIEELCDLSIFGITVDNKNKTEQQSFDSIPTTSTLLKDKEAKASQKSNKDLDITDICDLSEFLNEENVENINKSLKSSESTKKKLEIDDLCDLSDLLNIPHEQKIKKPVNAPDKMEDVVIDLTDSDLEKTPKKSKERDLSISEMLDFFNTQGNSNQKENNTPQRPIERKSTSSSGSKKKGILQLKQNRPNFKQSTPLAKKKFDITLTSNSDDEFENLTSSVFTKSKLMTKPKQTKQKINKKPKKLERKISDFIDEEAVLSEDDCVKVSDDEEDENNDEYEKSFVADESQYVPNTQMHVEYLKSVKSPRGGHGKFKIPMQPKNNVSYIFSQEVPADQDTYLDDSFCVNTETHEETQQHDLSELEILEMRLKEQQKNKRKKKQEENNVAKRRRIVVLSDSESD